MKWETGIVDKKLVRTHWKFDGLDTKIFLLFEKLSYSLSMIVC